MCGRDTGSKRTLLRPPETTYRLLAEPGKQYMAYARDLKNKVTIEFSLGVMGVRTVILFDPLTGETRNIGKASLLRDSFKRMPPDSGNWVLFFSN